MFAHVALLAFCVYMLPCCMTSKILRKPIMRNPKKSDTYSSCCLQKCKVFIEVTCIGAGDMLFVTGDRDRYTDGWTT